LKPGPTGVKRGAQETKPVPEVLRNPTLQRPQRRTGHNGTKGPGEKKKFHNIQISQNPERQRKPATARELEKKALGKEKNMTRTFDKREGEKKTDGENSRQEIKGGKETHVQDWSPTSTINRDKKRKRK